MNVFKRLISAVQSSALRKRLVAPKSLREKYLVRTGVFLAVGLFLYIILNDLVMPIITRHGQEFPLPNIVGMTVDQAAPVLKEADIVLEVMSQQYHPDKPTGTILSQLPTGGTMVKSGRAIKVVTSLGTKDVIVPGVSFCSIRQAEGKLDAVGLRLGSIKWEYSDSVPQKAVIFSFPESLTVVPYGSPINFMVSRGPRPTTVTVPRLVGKSLDEAMKILDEKGLLLGEVKRVVDERYLPETVLEQSQEAGTELMTGEAIDLVVSSTD